MMVYNIYIETNKFKGVIQMEKMAEKITMQLTEEQEKIMIDIKKEYDLSIPIQFDAVGKACEMVKNVRKELKIEAGDIINVSTPEEKKNSKEQIKKIVEYRKPIKSLRSKINKTMESNRKEILSKFDDINKEFGIIEDALKLGNEVYDEKQKAFREKEKRLIFEGIEKQFPEFTFSWDDKYINSSREVIEAELIEQMKKEKAKSELLQMKESFSENRINFHSKGYGIKTVISFTAVSHLFDFEEMTNEEIDETAEKYIISMQVIEAEAEANEQTRLEAVAKQKEYDDNKAKEIADKKEKEKAVLKENTILTILEYGKNKFEDLESKTQETLDFILEDLIEKIKFDEEADKKNKKIADDKKQELEKKQDDLKKEAENAKSRTLLVSIECIENYTDDFKAELEKFLDGFGIVKKYAVKVKGE